MMIPINKNLEEQAKSFLKEWEKTNSDNITYKKLSEIAIINPDSYSNKDNWDYVNYLDTSSIIAGEISELTKIDLSSDKLPSRAKRKIQSRDIVYSTVRPNQKHYGLVIDPVENMLVSTGFAVIRSRFTNVSNELIYLVLSSESIVESMQQLAEQSTSTFPAIKPSDLGECMIPCANDNCNMELIAELPSVFEMMNTNRKENVYLSELRDSLLPKLMAGEIDVSDIEI